jgi:hypothetical protein
MKHVEHYVVVFVHKQAMQQRISVHTFIDQVKLQQNIYISIVSQQQQQQCSATCIIVCSDRSLCISMYIRVY